MPKILVSLYMDCGNGHQEPTLDDLQHTLQGILSGFSSTFIILDALDECAERGKILNWIQTFVLVKDINLGLHLIATSHPEQEINDQFGAHDYIDLVKESGNDDLIAYLDYQLENDSVLQKWKLDVREQIKSILVEEADGMYVYF